MQDANETEEREVTTDQTDDEDEIEVNLKKGACVADHSQDEVEKDGKDKMMGGTKGFFMSEVLPKLPRLSNGMRLLGVHEQSPLIDSGELYKMRVFRPDKPIASSEIFEDGTRMRFTNLSKIGSDDFIISKFKIEMVTCKAGLADSDTVGMNAVKGVFEAEDACNLTMKPFVEMKIKGKASQNRMISECKIISDLMELVVEIMVLKRQKENEVMELKENCAMTYEGDCGAKAYCMICLINDDVKDITRIFESREEKMDYG